MGLGKPNPRGKKLEKQPGSGPRFGSPVIYILVLLVGFLLLRSLFQDAGFQRVPYSRLLERVQSDGCQKVVLSNEWVKCYPKAGETKGELPWFAVRVAGDTTTEVTDGLAAGDRVVLPQLRSTTTSTGGGAGRNGGGNVRIGGGFGG